MDKARNSRLYLTKYMKRLPTSKTSPLWSSCSFIFRSVVMLVVGEGGVEVEVCDWGNYLDHEAAGEDSEGWLVSS